MLSLIAEANIGNNLQKNPISNMSWGNIVVKASFKELNLAIVKPIIYPFTPKKKYAIFLPKMIVDNNKKYAKVFFIIIIINVLSIL